MTPIEQQMIDELIVTQGLTNNLAANLNSKGVPSNTNEGLDTLVPKVLQIESGTTKTPYEEWQEGFGANWDSVIQNAPMTNVYRILHVYTKVDLIKHTPESPTAFEILIYNPTTAIYRPVTIGANKEIYFVESDFFVNSIDGLSYCCVIYASTTWWTYHFRTPLPVVYSNSRYSSGDYLTNLIGDSQGLTNMPYLRGVDCYMIETLCIASTIEHISYQTTAATVRLDRISGTDTQAKLLKNLVDNLPVTASVLVQAYTVQYCSLTISDEKLADWVYNEFFYERYKPTSYVYGFPITNIVKRYKIHPDIVFSSGSVGSYLNLMPNMITIEGTITEDQTTAGTTYAGIHAFNKTWRNLTNFPMWKVLEGATTGCLLPMTTQTNVAIYTNGSFRFYSTSLNPTLFCEFDENGIIEDPTKYFICNLPFEINTHANIFVKFDDLTFKNYFTAEQINVINAYLTNKNWNLVW